MRDAQLAKALEDRLEFIESRPELFDQLSVSSRDEGWQFIPDLRLNRNTALLDTTHGRLFDGRALTRRRDVRVQLRELMLMSGDLLAGLCLAQQNADARLFEGCFDGASLVLESGELAHGRCGSLLEAAQLLEVTEPVRMLVERQWNFRKGFASFEH